MPLPFDDAWQDQPLYPMRDVHGVMMCTKYARGNSSTAFVSNLGFVVCFYRSLAFSFEQSAKPLSLSIYLSRYPIIFPVIPTTFQASSWGYAPSQIFVEIPTTF